MAEVLPVIIVDWFAYYVYFVNMQEQLALSKHVFESLTSVSKSIESIFQNWEVCIVSYSSHASKLSLNKQLKKTIIYIKNTLIKPSLIPFSFGLNPNKQGRWSTGPLTT